jgi:membrane protein
MIKRIQQWFLSRRLVRDTIALLKRTTLPGFDGLPIYMVMNFFIKEIRNEQLITKSSSVAFSFMLAIFPATIFLFTLIPYIPISGFQDQLMLLMQHLLPANAFESVQVTLMEIITQQNSGLLSLGFFAALFFSTNGVMALMRNFNNSSLILETRSSWRKRRIAILLTVLISTLLIVAVALITAGNFFVNLMKEHNIIKRDIFTYYSLVVLNWAIIIMLFFSIISSIYYFCPATVKKFKFFSAGSTLATILAIITSIGFAFYINNFGSYNKIYGSIGTLIVIMLWLDFNSVILLIGFELNASIDILKRNLPPPPPPRLRNRFRDNS